MEDPESAPQARQAAETPSEEAAATMDGRHHNLGFRWLLAQALEGNTAFPWMVRKRRQKRGGEHKRKINLETVREKIQNQHHSALVSY